MFLYQIGLKINTEVGQTAAENGVFGRFLCVI